MSMFCLDACRERYLSVTEVVLSVLVSTFTLEPSDKTIKWNMGTVWFPTVGDGTTPELPVKIGLYERVHG